MGILRRLDSRSLLGFDVWDFSARSLTRGYGRVFLGSLLLKHPVRLLKGLRKYQTGELSAQPIGRRAAGVAGESAFEAELAAGNWVAGAGYCQKSLEPACPSGRFNHSCAALAVEVDTPLPPACLRCRILELAKHALPAGASLYIMTSAADLAKDLLLAALRKPEGTRAVLSVCSYSVPPLSLAMTVCGVRGFLLSYSDGACEDYAMWLNADRGIKHELTNLTGTERSGLLRMLDRVAALRAASGRRAPQRFRQWGNLYHPE
jgi:hypothetical protein